MSLQLDIIGGGVSMSSGGMVVTRLAKFTGLPISNPDYTLIAAFLDTGLPQYGDAHPENTALVSAGWHPLYLSDIQVEPEMEDNTTALVTLTYSVLKFETQPPSEDPDAVVIEVGTTVTTKQTNKDKDGDQLTVSITFAEDTRIGTDKDGQPIVVASDTKGVTIDATAPETVLRFNRREPSSPFAKSIAYVNKTNSAVLGGSTYAVGTLLCTGISGRYEGGAWDVLYEFQYNVGGHEVELIYNDGETGEPHRDVVVSGTPNGYTTAAIYGAIDFDNLDLPF